MTNKELCNFLLARAADLGREYGIKDPKLVIHRNGSNLYLAIEVEGHAFPFHFRFTKGPTSAVFKFTSIDPAFAQFKSDIIAMMNKLHIDSVSYDVIDIPKFLKNKVSATLVQAFKTKGMGMALSSPVCSFELVKPNETYEEISIENDLNAYLSCDLASF